jgi:hypothetical protein
MRLAAVALAVLVECRQMVLKVLRQAVAVVVVVDLTESEQQDRMAECGLNLHQRRKH